MDRIPVPTKVYVQDRQAVLEAAELSPAVYDAPFLSDGLRQALAAAGAALSLTHRPVRQLPDEGGLPAGLIFHVSRCGSTLVSQMLATLPGVRAVSEPEAVSLYLLECARGACAFEAEEFRRLIKAFGRGLQPGAPYVIKLSSWNVMFLDQIRGALPEVPWAFLTRDPAEVLVSNVRHPSAPLRWYRGMDPYLEACFPDCPVERRGAPEEFFAWCLACYSRKARQHQGPHGVWVDYAQLPGALYSHILPHFGLEATESERARMMARSQYRAKGNTQEPFSPDGERKAKAATEAVRVAVKRWCEGAG
ncbi:hypothetical protein WME91_30640 [Sorangium sp. So ce269]